MTPQTWKQWQTALLVMLGATLGLVRYPLAILAGGPLARAIRAFAHASQESAFQVDAVGDGGSSIGVLQWNSGNDTVPQELRRSAFWSGWYQPAEVQRALLHSWRWWVLAVPVLGFGAERYLWTHGYSAASARAAWSGDAAGVTWWSQAKGERRAWLALLAAQGAVLSLALPLWRWLSARKGRR